MRKQLYSFTVLCLAIFLLSSCRKSTDVISNQQNIEGTWAITGISSDRAYDFNGDGRTETDIYGNYTSCGRDIVLQFQSNGYGQIRQGCNAYWQNISWNFYNNNRTLVLSLPDDELNLDLSVFDNYTIRGTDRVAINGSYYNITYTFQRR